MKKFLVIITLIIFNFSKIGLVYPDERMIKEVRNIVILIFVPINGFISLPHIANIKSKIASSMDNDKIKRRIINEGDYDYLINRNDVNSLSNDEIIYSKGKVIPQDFDMDKLLKCTYKKQFEEI